jgi:hypothetical protein
VDRLEQRAVQLQALEGQISACLVLGASDGLLSISPVGFAAAAEAEEVAHRARHAGQEQAAWAGARAPQQGNPGILAQGHRRDVTPQRRPTRAHGSWRRVPPGPVLAQGVRKSMARLIFAVPWPRTSGFSDPQDGTASSEADHDRGRSCARAP